MNADELIKLLTAKNDRLGLDLIECQSENAALKAEIERLKADNDRYCTGIDTINTMAVKYKREAERLRKALEKIQQRACEAACKEVSAQGIDAVWIEEVAEKALGKDEK